VARELASWGDFGHRLGSHALVARLVDHLDGLDELDAGDTEPRRPARHVHPVPGATDTTASIVRLGYAEIRTVLYAALHARRAAYPGPVGEVVARELAGYIDIDLCLGPSALPWRVLDEVLTSARYRPLLDAAPPSPPSRAYQCLGPVRGQRANSSVGTKSSAGHCSGCSGVLVMYYLARPPRRAAAGAPFIGRRLSRQAGAAECVEVGRKAPYSSSGSQRSG
jgi:hypothetical protein